MTIKLASLKADLDREEKGDWIDYPEWPGVAFNVSSLHIEAFQTARDLLFQRLAKQFKGRKVPQKVINAEMGKLYAVHILHNWRGLDVDYSAEMALTILGDAEYRNVVAAVEHCAGMVSAVDVEFVEEDVKNSGKPSARA